MTDPNPAQRRDMWFSNNFEYPMPEDPEDRADYQLQLAREAHHGPAAGQEHLT